MPPQFLIEIYALKNLYFFFLFVNNNIIITSGYQCSKSITSLLHSKNMIASRIKTEYHLKFSLSAHWMAVFPRYSTDRMIWYISPSGSLFTKYNSVFTK